MVFLPTKIPKNGFLIQLGCRAFSGGLRAPSGWGWRRRVRSVQREAFAHRGKPLGLAKKTTNKWVCRKTWKIYILYIYMVFAMLFLLFFGPEFRIYDFWWFQFMIQFILPNLDSWLVLANQFLGDLCFWTIDLQLSQKVCPVLYHHLVGDWLGVATVPIENTKHSLISRHLASKRDSTWGSSSKLIIIIFTKGLNPFLSGIPMCR